MSVLDLDFYKLTMLQFIWKHYADVPVTFQLHSRKQRLEDILYPAVLLNYVKTYQRQTLGFHEQQYLRSLGIFEEAFLDDLTRLFYKGLPHPTLKYDGVEVSGRWFEVMLWETVILSMVTELHSYNNVEPPTVIRHAAEINKVIESGAAWVDFGTRRRWSLETHNRWLNIMKSEPDTRFGGTSNVHLARRHGLKPAGTYAHELEMVLRPYFKDEFSTTRDVLEKWGSMYPRELRIALTDTYTTEKFLREHGRYLFDNDWRGVRLDSGDPVEMGSMVKRFLYGRGHEWDVVFSDGLDANTIVKLQETFSMSLNMNPMYGWGTGFTNPNSNLSLVMKAVESNGQSTYKITDDAEKSIR